MSRHTVTVQVSVEIEYDFIPGTRAVGPSYSHGGLPADPAEVNIVSATMLGVKLPVEAEAALEGDEAVYGECVDEAEHNSDHGGTPHDD